MNDKAMIIDGHNFLFRSFYGVPSQVRFSDGTRINAVYGFFSLLRSALTQASPEYLAVVFDSETSAGQKKAILPEYKANRVIQDENIFEQLKIIKRCLDILGIFWIEDDSNEADDVIGSLAKVFSHSRKTVYICSNDNDFIQLIKEDTFVIKKSRGANLIFNRTKVREEYGICPERYLDYLTLVGDTSDNIPGVKGIGRTYALQMISGYGDVASIIRSILLLPHHLRNKMSGQEHEIINRKDFLLINSETPLPTTFAISKCLHQRDAIPNKMGIFLRKYWDEIST